MAETKQFKAESKRLLDMMINSIYTHKEIFLRELISNASDAMDKLYFLSLTDDKVGMNRSDFFIKIETDAENRVITIRDNGIGMTKDELDNNLGTIANSGSFSFKNDENNTADDIDIIGQFGVGFYSAFMVAKEVEVRTKAYGSDTAYLWKSQGVDGYTVEECEKDGVGSEIKLYLKDDTDDESYEEFLMQWKIKMLVKKYSDYIHYPIKFDMEHDHLVEGTGVDDVPAQYHTHVVEETLNSMTPLWRKNKSEITDEEYNQFYKEKFFDYRDPLKHIHVKTEGTATYDSVLFIPSATPMDFYTKSYEKGLQLYSSGVLIMDKCSDLIPEHFCFVRGLVDSQDLSLNISREMLQHDRQLKIIAKSLEKTIKNELKKMLTNEREKYEQFWKLFGMQIKFGVYNNGYGTDNDLLKDLLIFVSSMEKKYVTLDEYISRMKEDQKYIYYATAETVDKADALPQTEVVKDKGYEILYLTESIDEFAVKIMGAYGEKQFKSISDADLDLETAEEKEEFRKLSEESKDMLGEISSALGGKIASAKLSERLKSHAVCLTSEGQISLEMEKAFMQMPDNQGVVASKVLEINPKHPIFEVLKGLYETDKAKLGDYSKMLYTQALLIEGMPVENPLEFSDLVCRLMTEKK